MCLVTAYLNCFSHFLFVGLIDKQVEVSGGAVENLSDQVGIEMVGNSAFQTVKFQPIKYLLSLSISS